MSSEGRMTKYQKLLNILSVGDVLCFAVKAKKQIPFLDFSV